MKMFILLRAFLLSTFNMGTGMLSNFLERKFTLGVIPLASREMATYNGNGAAMAAAAAAAAANAAASNAANNPMVNVPGELDVMPIPQALTITHTSTNAGTAKTTYFLNTQSTTGYNTQPTDNDGGAGTIVNTYGDGWSGRGYDQLARSLNGGRGIKIYGFTMHYITTSTGAENSAGLTTAAPTLLYYTNLGTSSVPKPISLNSGARNTQYLAGEMTVKTIFWMNAVCQVSYVLPINTTLSVTWMTQPL